MAVNPFLLCLTTCECHLRMPRVALHTLGCKLNFAETATLTRSFEDAGYEVTS